MKSRRMYRGIFPMFLFFTFFGGQKTIAQTSCCEDGFKPASITLTYTGESCSSTSTTQSSDKHGCYGDPSFDTEVYIIANDDNNASSGDIWFSGVVQLDSQFTIQASNAGATKFSSNTVLHIFSHQGGTLLQKVNFHTSCSQPLLIGDQYGSLVLEGMVSDEGVACGSSTTPPSSVSCCEDGFKPASISLTYTGESCSSTSTTQSSDKHGCYGDPSFDTEVYIIANNDNNASSGDIWFSGVVQLDSQFTIQASNAGATKFSSNTVLHIFSHQGGTLLQKVNFHTSCSQPLLIGDQYGSLVLDGMVSDQGVSCGSSTTPPSNESCCTGGNKPVKITFQYTGDDCSATQTSQSSSRYGCTGDPNFLQEVYIVANNKLNIATGLTWFEGNVSLNRYFEIDAANGGESRLRGETYVHIFDEQGGTKLQTVFFHTSCSEPIFINDQYGSVRINNIDFENGDKCGQPFNPNSINVISGYTFYDLNQDTIFGNGEPAISNMSVTLFRDNNCDGHVDANDDSIGVALTNADGYYEFIQPWSGTPEEVNVQVNAGNHDADEKSDGSMELSHGDLHFNERLSGIHLTNINVPSGATIESAYLEFVADRDESGSATVRIFADDVNNSSAPTSATNNLSSRTKTTNFVQWTMTDWDDQLVYQSPDISDVVQEIVNRSGWTALNNMTFLIVPHAGSHKRKAVAYNRNASEAPKLVLTYSTGVTTECYITRVDTLTEPDQNSPTTDILETAVFTSGGNHDSLNNFGFYGELPDGLNLISGYVFADADEDAEFDPIEIGLGGVEVSLYRDINCDSILDAGDTYAGNIFTDNDGFYSFAVPYQPVEGSAEYQINQDNNDAEEHSNGDVDLGHDHLHMNDRKVAVRFTSVAIPANATIQSARLVFTSDNDKSSAAQVRIYGEDVASSSSFTGVDDELTNRVRTTAFVNWSFSPWTKNSIYNSPDISSVLQEIVNRGDWNSGQNLTLLIDPLTGGGERVATAHDDVPASAPKLIIEYTLNGSKDCYITKVSQDFPDGYTYLTTDSLQHQVFTGINQEDINNNFGMWGPGGVPVELIEFSAVWKGNDADLLWVTASEENNSHFEVQRSFDGKYFEKIARVNSLSQSGNSLNTLFYDFVDYNLKERTNGHVFYRLKQVDFDGQFDYSPVIILNASEPALSELKLYPNPTNNSINVQLNDVIRTSPTIRIMDMNGAIILDKVIDQSVGMRTIGLDLPMLDRGIYILELESGFDVHRKTFVVRHH